jgi:1,4-alpha-glucan branching enzyme
MMSQLKITAETGMGANVVQGGGVTFKVWAPRATAVYVNRKTPELLMAKQGNGYWTGYLPEAREGDAYRFYVVGKGSEGYKRDPYARELANDPAAPFPECAAVVRGVDAYPWHDAGFKTPEFRDMVVYQLHVGTFAPECPGWAGTFLDVAAKVEYLAALGVNMVQPLPVYEMEDSPSLGYPGLGYQGSDLFSPAIDYAVYHEDSLEKHLATVNLLLAAKGFGPMALADLRPGFSQLKAMVDLLHVYGIGVMFDVVHNHAGGWGQTYQTPHGVVHGDDESLYFWDRADGRAAGGGVDNNQSLYFTDQGFVGGLSFALWNADVRAFLLNNARFHVEELHADGIRYDEVSMLLAMNRASGWEFCTEVTGAVRTLKPRALQNAEYWPNEYGVPWPTVVAPVDDSGLGFDAVQHDGMRNAVRAAIGQASSGRDATVDMRWIGRALYPTGFSRAWQTIPCVENHDIVKLGERPRMPALADDADRRSWYARSRTRVAMALLLTAPGIPQLFMGQEFLEDKQWCPDPRTEDHLIWWGGLAAGADGRAVDQAMVDHLRFTQDAVRLRCAQPALRGEGLNVFYASDADRVIAFQRWVEGEGRDVVVVASLREETWWGYELGFPSAGRWVEVFNSDVYDHWVNPECAGNEGGVEAAGPGMHGLAASARVVIPANGVVVFVKG